MTVGGGRGSGGGPHVLLLYRDQSGRQANVVSWVKGGLDRGEKILYSTPSGDGASARELGQGDPDMARAMRAGQFTFLPLEEFLPPTGQATLVRRALDEGYPGVRMSAYANAAISYLGEHEYQAFDRRMEELCASLPVSALCQYDAGSAASERPGPVTAGTTMTTVIDSHEVLHDARMRLRRHGERITVSGEVDVASADVLAPALQRICRLEDASGVVLDLSELSFIDVVGCRALVVGTDELRRKGGTVTCRGVRSPTRQLMSWVGLDRLRGVELA